MTKHVTGFICFAMGFVVAYILHISIMTKGQSDIDYTLKKNADIMEEVIAVNSRIEAIQDVSWRIGHYTNENHGKGRTVCPECSGLPDVTTMDGIRRAEELGTEERPDTLETVRENSDEILAMIQMIRTTLFSVKITEDIILDNLRKANVEAK